MRLVLLLLLCLAPFAARPADEDWQAALANMPLRTNVTDLNRSNCVPLMLRAFQSNSVVKALIFMPGATDEFYWYKRARASLTNRSPSLLDAVNALTNQTRIRVKFLPPLLLLHSDSDPLEPLAEVRDIHTATQLLQKKFAPHVLYDDRDWDSIFRVLKKNCAVDILPGLHAKASFHFFRHSFAAWNLSRWEALEAVSLADRTKFTVEKKRVIFQLDDRDLRYPQSAQ